MLRKIIRNWQRKQRRKAKRTVKRKVVAPVKRKAKKAVLGLLKEYLKSSALNIGFMGVVTAIILFFLDLF